MTVYVCPVKDIECGNHKVGWCDACPKHGKQANVHRGPEPDCRTCRNTITQYGVTRCNSTVVCTDADRYEPLPPVRLWKSNDRIQPRR